MHTKEANCTFSDQRFRDLLSGLLMKWAAHPRELGFPAFNEALTA
jgi:hypothetical protein